MTPAPKKDRRKKQWNCQIAGVRTASLRGFIGFKTMAKGELSLLAPLRRLGEIT